MGHLPRIQSTSSSLRTEILGTFLLVLIGTSALTALNVAGQATSAAAILVGTITFSVAIGWLTYIFYRFPLPQFNPATTMMFWLQGLQPFSRSMLIIFMQLLGAIAASVVVALLYGSAGVEVRLGAPYPATLMGSWAALIAEFLGSLLVLYAVQTAMKQQRLVFFNPFLLISLGYSLGYLLSTGISGGSLNPARALAPQLAAADLTGWWAYIVGPFAAAAILGIWERHFNQTSLATSQPTTTQAQDRVADRPIKPIVTINEIPYPQADSSRQDNQQDQSPEIEPESHDEVEFELEPNNESEDQEQASEPEETRRPKLPFAITKPSFYPLIDSAKQFTKPKPARANSNIEPESQPSTTSEPEAQPQSTTKPSVKFVNFESDLLEDSSE